VQTTPDNGKEEKGRREDNGLMDERVQRRAALKKGGFF
jgi:hypothetical protein